MFDLIRLALQTDSTRVVTLTLDLGQGVELADVRARALATGAVRAHVLDVREAFALRFVRPLLGAGARLDGHLVGPSAPTLPIVAEQLALVAGMEGSSCVAHGGAPDDRRRLESDVRLVDPRVSFVDVPGRDDWAVGEASAPVADRNLWGRTMTSPTLLRTWEEPAEELFTLTEAPAAASDMPALVDIEVADGQPSRVNGVAMSFVELVASLETIAGDHGVGRLDLIEPRGDGTMKRVVAEAPAAVVLDSALRALEALVYDASLGRLARQVGDAYGALLAEGRWFSPTRDVLDAFVTRAHALVSGTVRLRLFKGECRVVGRSVRGADTPASRRGA